MHKALRFLPLIVVLALVVIFSLPLLQHKDAKIISSVLIGRAMPETVLSAQDLDHRVALVNFFASWCVSCTAEQQELQKIAKEKKISIFGIAYKDKPDALKKWLSVHGNPFKKIAMDNDGRAGIDWGVSGVPETFVVDAAGIVRYRHVGPVTAESFAREIAPVLETLATEGGTK